jgi:hypothetical protein
MTVAQDAGFAVSPAGDFVVYETVRNGRSELWYRSLLDAAVRPIPGTDGGSQPVLSPDGHRIAFFRLADGGWTVEVVPVEGGGTTTVGRGVSSIRKLFWPRGDRILLLLSDAGQARWLDPERGHQSRSHTVKASFRSREATACYAAGASNNGALGSSSAIPPLGGHCGARKTEIDSSARPSSWSKGGI